MRKLFVVLTLFVLLALSYACKKEAATAKKRPVSIGNEMLSLKNDTFQAGAKMWAFNPVEGECQCYQLLNVGNELVWLVMPDETCAPIPKSTCGE